MRALLWSGLAVIAGCVMTPLTPAFRDQAAHMLIVSVEPPGDNEGEKGSGILIGADSTSLYVLTAKHVVEPYGVDTPLKIRSPLWPEREFESTLRLYDRDKNLQSLPSDRAVLVLPRAQLRGVADPFWRVLPSESEPQLRCDVFIIGRQHGLIVKESVRGRIRARPEETYKNTPAQGTVAGNRAGTDTFTISASSRPDGGDSGGGVFDGQWRLLGMHPRDDADGIVTALRMDRLLERVKGLDAGHGIPIKLERAPRVVPPWLAYVGAGILITGASVGIAARVQREHYYRDPTRDRDRVHTLNVTADVLMSTGAGVGLFVAATWLARVVTERRYTQAWTP